MTSSERLRYYANLFPTIGERGTWAELQSIVAHGVESSGTQHAARFLLNIWNGGLDGDDAFNIYDALGVWDEEHFRAFMWVLEDRWQNGGL